MNFGLGVLKLLSLYYQLLIIMYGQGKLYFRYGTMGSAKTALLLTQAYNFEERNICA